MNLLLDTFYEGVELLANNFSLSVEDEVFHLRERFIDLAERDLRVKPQVGYCDDNKTELNANLQLILNLGRSNNIELPRFQLFMIALSESP